MVVKQSLNLKKKTKMEEIGRPKSWTEELASLVEDTGIRYTGDDHTLSGLSTPSFELKSAMEGERVESESESLKDQMKGFVKAWGEIAIELGKGCKDVVLQSVLTDDSYIVKKTKGPCRVVAGKLSVLNDFLPEDRHPVHAWPVILSVFLVALSGNSTLTPLKHQNKFSPFRFTFFLSPAVLSLNIKHENTPIPLVQSHPPSANRILLPDGRNISYHEQGVPADKARYSLIAPHAFLSSRLSGRNHY